MSIGDYVFYNCSALKEINIPDSLISIGSNPFKYCESLTKIKISPDHPIYATIDGVLFNKKEKQRNI